MQKAVIETIANKMIESNQKSILTARMEASTPNATSNAAVSDAGNTHHIHFFQSNRCVTKGAATPISNVTITRTENPAREAIRKMEKASASKPIRCAPVPKNDIYLWSLSWLLPSKNG